MRELLEYQADRIEAVLAHHKIPARVTGGTVTPRWIRFQVVPTLGTRIAAITGLAEELAAALDVPAVRVARQGAVIAVEVPRDDPRPVRLLPLLAGLRNVPPVTAVLGIADDGTPLLIRLPSPDVAHILVAGTTGSGKTVLLRAVVLSLAYFNEPERLRFVLIDPKGRAFADMADLPHLARPVITDPQEAAEALGSLVRLMELGGAGWPVILVIDELVDLLMVADLESALQRLVQRGREAGIHVVAATQKPTAAVIGSLVKANFPVRLVGKVTSPEDARVATGWPGSGAERLLGRGDFIAVAEGQLHRFQAAHIAPEEAKEVVERLAGHFPRSRLTVTRTPATDLQPAERILPAQPLPPLEPDPVSLAMERLKRAGWTPEWSYRRSCRALGEEQGGAGFWLVKEAVDRLRGVCAAGATATATATNILTSDQDGGDGHSPASSSSDGNGYDAELDAWLRWAQ